MFFQKKTGSTDKNEVKSINEEDLAKFEKDIKWYVLWNVLTEFAPNQIEKGDIVTVWDEVAIQVNKRIKDKDISLVDNLTVDGSFMKATYKKYMKEYLAKYGPNAKESEIGLNCSFMLFKLNKLKFKLYELMTKLSEERYDQIQTEKYLSRRAKRELKLELEPEPEYEEIDECECLKEELEEKDKELERKDKIIEELTLENKGLLKINEELKNIGKS